MRKSLSLFLFMIIYFIGIGANLDKPQHQILDVESMLKDFDAAIASRDLDKIMTFFTDDCVLDDTNLWVLKHGKAEVKASIKESFDAFPDFKITIKTRIISGNRVASEWAMTGTHAGPLRNLPATGKYISIPGASFMEIQDGRIKRRSQYYNLMRFLQQLGVGLVPQPQ